MTVVSGIAQDEALFERRGPVGLITLSRPRALNALSLGMVQAMDARLKAWADDAGVRAVVVRGAGDRAFCAGGDVRAVYQDGLAARAGAGGALTVQFFWDEYRLNRRIKRFPKPYVALIDGIVMGGGVGVSIHGSHRVATERTLCAMPETGIGFFPDVGATWALSRMAGEIGTYLALTGERIGPSDALYAGFATHMAASERLDALVGALTAADYGDDAGAAVDRTLAAFSSPPGAEAELAHARPMIDRCFGFDDVADIVAHLDAERSDWGTATRARLAKASPTSLKTTLRALREARGLEFEEALAVEYRLSQGFMRGHDFYEGIRAVLVDKDQAPRWRPSSLDAVTDSMVEAHFAPPLARDLTFDD